MSGRRLVAAAVVLLAVVALLVVVGRWEQSRRADDQVEGMSRVLATVGELDSPELSAFRYLSSFQCLLFRRGENRVALELCFDDEGRLIEAIDRRSGDPNIWSLRDDPERSTIRVDRAEVDRLLVRMGVPERLIDELHGQAGR